MKRRSCGAWHEVPLVPLAVRRARRDPSKSLAHEAPRPARHRHVVSRPRVRADLVLARARVAAGLAVPSRGRRSRGSPASARRHAARQAGHAAADDREPTVRVSARRRRPAAPSRSRCPSTCDSLTKPPAIGGLALRVMPSSVSGREEGAAVQGLTFKGSRVQGVQGVQGVQACRIQRCMGFRTVQGGCNGGPGAAAARRWCTARRAVHLPNP